MALALWLAQDGPTGPTAVFLQYGVLGALTVILLVALAQILRFVKNVYDRMALKLDEAQEEIARLNQVIQDKQIPALLESQRALKDTSALLAELQAAGLRKPAR